MASPAFRIPLIFPNVRKLKGGAINAVCPICGSSYEARNSRSRFCSAPCRAKYARRRAGRQRELLAQQTEAIFLGADPVVLRELAERARRLIGSV